MPAFYFVCKKCSKQSRRILKEYKELDCECGSKLDLDMSKSPSSMIKEVMDNGLMFKSVERLADIDEMVHKRAEQDSKDRAKDKDPELV